MPQTYHNLACHIPQKKRKKTFFLSKQLKLILTAITSWKYKTYFLSSLREVSNLNLCCLKQKQNQTIFSSKKNFIFVRYVFELIEYEINTKFLCMCFLFGRKKFLFCTQFSVQRIGEKLFCENLMKRVLYLFSFTQKRKFLIFIRNFFLLYSKAFYKFINNEREKLFPSKSIENK